MSKTTIHRAEDVRRVRYYVYVYEFPVRLFHWLNAIAIVVLAATGYMMGNPLAVQTTTEASMQYWFGTTRFIHFTAAYVWVAVAVLRLYWGFVGNEYVRFKQFLPTTREQWQEIWSVLRVDVLQIWRGATFSVGHNALAGFTYAIAFVFFLFQMATGFALYEPMSASWFAGLFGWVVPLFGSEHLVRLLHHGAMYIFLLFMFVHVYLVFYHDYVEATGTLSSMVGGWKFVQRRPRDLPPQGTPVVPPIESPAAT